MKKLLSKWPMDSTASVSGSAWLLVGPPEATFCEAQGKGRAKGRPRKVTKRSFIDMDGGWWLSFP